MKLSEEDKKYILNEHLRNISHIANEEYQKRVWVHGEGTEVDDFDETVCHFFDDGDPILKKYKEYKVTEEQYQLLVQFRNSFESFVYGDRPYLPEEFIATPEWRKIVTMAKEVVKTFE